MKTATLLPSVVHPTGRLDANYFLAPGVAARARLAVAEAVGVELRPLEKFAEVSRPTRLKAVLVDSPSEGVPYLRPTDVFEYFPFALDYLSTVANKNASLYQIERNVILQTRSGRNLGPSALADACLAGYAVSDDMLRVHIQDDTLRFYAFTFFQTDTGLQILRRSKTGSVIDHLDEPHLRKQVVPMLGEEQIKSIAGHMKKAFLLKEEARTTISQCVADFEAALPTVQSKPLHKGWTLRAQDYGGRLDAAFHAPQVVEIQKLLKAAGGQRLGKVAHITKPAGRYKTRYVESEYGLPMLSGSHLLQVRPMKLQYMAAEAIGNPERYALKSGWTVFQADGRAEDSLALPVMVTPDRDGWLASGHVGRAIPKEGVNPGWLYLAIKCSAVQVQLKALSCGSVVDALYPDAMKSVVLPSQDIGDGERVAQAWELFGKAQAEEDTAVRLFNEKLDEACARGAPKTAEENLTPSKKGKKKQ